jgi:putative DNA primase/helicase
MVAAVVDIENRLTGLHVTPLDKYGRRAERKKIMLGKVKGCSVRLAPFDAAAGIIAVAEGIETALAYSALKGVPTWAALSAGGLQNWVSPLEPLCVVIAADTDDSGAGMNAAKALTERLCRLHDVVIDPAPNGRDWADVVAGVVP